MENIMNGWIREKYVVALFEDTFKSIETEW